MRKRRGTNAAPTPAGPSESVFPARIEGKKLYVNMPFGVFDKKPTKGEQVYDWTGPDGAHHATLEYSSATMVYTVRIECKISVFDAAGNLLGEIVEEHWN